MASEPPDRTAGRLLQRLRESLGIDTRALAAFRVSVGFILLLDLWNRSRNLVAHYSDAGVVPRSALMAMQEEWRFSVYLAGGEPWFVLLLFGVTAVLAVALILGVRTRSVTFLLWILTASLHTRAPDLIQAGDSILGLYLIWALFLPLGAAWSVERALDTSGAPPPRTARGAGPAGILIQILCIYFFAAVLKDHPAWLGEGRAVQYALMLEQLTTPLAVPLLQAEGLLKVATWGTMVVEGLLPLLLLFGVGGPRFRMAMVFLFVCLHLSFVPVMTLGQFPFISLIGWLLFIPGRYWDAFARRMRASGADGLVIRYDADCGFCRKMVHLLRTFLYLPQAQIETVQEHAPSAERFRCRNTWVVETPDGRLLDRFEALAGLLRVSRVSRPLAGLAAFPLAQRIGDRAYGVVADDRRAASRLVSAFEWRKMRWTPSRPGTILAGGLLLLVLAWNLWTVDSRYAAGPPGIRWAGELLRVDQRWRMFAPFPLTTSGRVVGIAEGTEGGRYILAPDARAPLPEPVFRDPAFRSDTLFGWSHPQVADVRVARYTYRSQRWRKFHERIMARPELAELYGAFLCRDYARRHPGAEPLVTVAIMLEYRNVRHDTHTWTERRSRELATIECAGG